MAWATKTSVSDCWAPAGVTAATSTAKSSRQATTRRPRRYRMGPGLFTRNGALASQKTGCRRSSEGAPASAAHAAARGSSGQPPASTPGIARSPARGQQGLLRARGKAAEAPLEAVEVEAAARNVPRGLADGQPVESVDPALAHAQCDGPGQPLVHGVGRQASKLVLAGALEELPEALDALEGLHPAPGLARHDARQRDHDETGETRPEREGHRRRPQPIRPGGERPPRHADEGEARHEPDRAHPFRRGGKESVADHAPVDLVPHGGEDVVVVAPEVGEVAAIEPPVAAEEPAEDVELERLEGGIARERLEPVKDEILLAEVGLDLLDADIAAHGQIDEGGDHVAWLRPLRYESSPRRGTKSLGRGILRLDGAG